MIREITRLGNPILRTKTHEVARDKVRTERIQTLIADMIETLKHHDGVGLAAPQVNELDAVIIVAFPKDENDTSYSHYRAFINPKIIASSEDIEEDWEGCLSFNELRGKVPRASHITVHALTQDGDAEQIEVSGFAARVIQHEIDHLQGILYPDRMTDMSSLMVIDEFKKQLKNNA